MKKQERIERFEMLVEVLERAPDENFDIRSWGFSLANCGTTACALGWAAIDPVLSKRLGIKMDCEGVIVTSISQFEKIGIETHLNPKHGVHSAAGFVVSVDDDRIINSGFAAGAAAFGIEDTLSAALFDEANYRQWADEEPITRNVVISRIKALVEILKGREIEEDVISHLERAEQEWLEAREIEILAEIEKGEVKK